MRVLPQTLFGRLILATVAVIAVTQLVMVVLIVRDRREFAFMENGSGAVIERIVQKSHEIAELPAVERSRALEALHGAPIRIMPTEHFPLPPRAIRADAEDAFVRELHHALGGSFQVRVDSRPPERPRIEFAEDARPPPVDSRPTLPGGAPPWERAFAITVVLPDGAGVAFRAPPPRGAPPLPHRLFLQLGVLTITLGVVLYAMTRTITRPLAALVTAADAAGRGAAPRHLPERGARELREAARAFNAMHERLARYLDSRTRVLAAMSHDLRTPLTCLRLRIDVIDDRTLRKRCEDDLGEMNRMVDNALGMFRTLNDDESAAPFDMDALLRNLQEEQSELGNRVSIEGWANGPFIGRRLALKRCLGNLLANAVRYGREALVRIEDGEALIIKVLDRGPGIPPEALEKVFEPFFRLEGSRNLHTGGAGLGLSIARDVAQAHGGSIELSNRTEGGLEARVTLPRRHNL